MVRYPAAPKRGRGRPKKQPLPIFTSTTPRLLRNKKQLGNPSSLGTRETSSIDNPDNSTAVNVLGKLLSPVAHFTEGDTSHLPIPTANSSDNLEAALPSSVQELPGTCENPTPPPPSSSEVSTSSNDPTTVSSAEDPQSGEGATQDASDFIPESHPLSIQETGGNDSPPHSPTVSSSDLLQRTLLLLASDQSGFLAKAKVTIVCPTQTPKAKSKTPPLRSKSRTKSKTPPLAPKSRTKPRSAVRPPDPSDDDKSTSSDVQPASDTRLDEKKQSGSKTRSQGSRTVSQSHQEEAGPSGAQEEYEMVIKALRLGVEVFQCYYQLVGDGYRRTVKNRLRASVQVFELTATKLNDFQFVDKADLRKMMEMLNSVCHNQGGLSEELKTMLAVGVVRLPCPGVMTF